MTTTPIRETAQIMLESGLSVMPVQANKKSIGSWKRFQIKALPVAGIPATFNGAGSMAVVGGQVSGNLEDLDIDEADLYEEVSNTVKESFPDILDRFIFCKTPNGYGIVWRCEESVPGNQKLAMTWDEVEGPGEYIWNDRTKLKAREVEGKWIVSACRLETRGEGGYFLVEPSPGYEILEGSYENLKPISKEVRDYIIEFARTYDETPKKKKAPTKKKQSEAQPESDLPIITRLGDVFNDEGDIKAMLMEAGWRECGKTSKGLTMTRPGKDEGVSGQIHDNDGYFFCYTSNAPPLDSETQYSPFKLLAALECDNDFSEAVKLIASMGVKVNMDYEEVRHVLSKNPAEIDNAFRNSGLTEDEVCNICSDLGLAIPDGRRLGRITVQYLPTELNRVVKQLDAGLSSVSGEWGYYTFMGAACGYVTEYRVSASAGTTESYSGFREYTVDSLELRIEQSAIVESRKQGKDGKSYWYAERCPTHIIKKIMSYPSSTAKSIDSFSSHPSMDRNGNIFGLQYGYESCIYFTQKTKFDISDLTFKECYDKVVEITCQDILFEPEQKELMTVAYVGAAMTGIIRSSMGGGCPGLFISSQEPGTGKSIAAQILCNIWLGNDSSSFAWNDNNEELVKTLTADLITGKEVILMDNIPERSKLDDSTLAQALTAGSYIGRKLGKSEALNVKCNNVFIFAGNKLRMSPEMSRRLVTIHLRADVYNPAARRVRDNDILRTIRKKRIELVSYLLRMLELGAKMENKVDKQIGCGTFWDHFVRNPLLAELGVDIANALGVSQQGSEDKENNVRAISALKAWADSKKIGTNKTMFTSRTLFNEIADADEQGKFKVDRIATEVKDALTDVNILSWKSTTHLSTVLKRMSGILSETGLILHAHKTKGHAIKWWLNEDAPKGDSEGDSEACLEG